MHRRTRTLSGRCDLAARAGAAAVAAALLGPAAGAWAQNPPAAVTAAQTGPASLREAFEAAWARQPEAAALAARRDAARAQQQAAQAWTPEPAALELSGRSDRLGRNLGKREVEVGVALPLWLPGERGRHEALAEAEARAIGSRTVAVRLRLAAGVREAWWGWQRARSDSDAARAQLDRARAIATDVARRLKAGDLARADQHQADGAVAAAEAALAQADAAAVAAQYQLSAWTAAAWPAAAPPPDAEPEPVADADTGTGDNHAELAALADRAATAEGSAALAATQTRANPELTLATTRDRGVYGEASQQTVTLGLRIPFGAGPRHDARMAAARADLLELQAQIALERARLAGEQAAARARAEAARTQLAAAERRAQLAHESRGFFDKSFRLGETDLPTRLRIEAEATDAERQAARARIDLAAAISAWRQALGLLPQ